MKYVYNIFVLVLLFLLFPCGDIDAQIVKFKSYRMSSGVSGVDKNGMFTWGAWVNNVTDITIDLTHGSVSIEDTESGKSSEFKIYVRPQKWIVKRTFKTVNFECADDFYNKVNVKLYKYDNGEFRVAVMSADKATRYSVVYLDNSEIQGTIK